MATQEELTDYVVTRWYRAPELMLQPQILAKKLMQLAGMVFHAAFPEVAALWIF